jgi:hypothetical protein
MLQPARFHRWWSRRDEVLPSPPAVDTWSYPQTTTFLPSPPAFLPEFCVTLAQCAVGKMGVWATVVAEADVECKKVVVVTGNLKGLRPFLPLSQTGNVKM